MSRRSILIAGVFALVGALAVGAAVWLDNPRTLVAAARYAEARSGGQLSFDGISGTLLRPIHVGRMEWLDRDRRLVLEDVTLHWSPAWLLLATASFHDVHVAKGTLTVPPGSANPSRPPESLHLPLRVRMHDATIATFDVDDTDAIRQVTGLNFDATASWQAWNLVVNRLATPMGVVTAHARVDTDAPFAVDGALNVVREGDRPLRLDVTARGILERVQFAATLRAQSSAAEGTLVYRPFVVQTVESADATLNAVDLRHIVPGAPEVILDGSMHAAASGDTLRGTASLVNRARGTLDQGRIPLAKAEAQIGAAPGAWSLETLELDLGDAGTLSGRGRIALDGLSFSIGSERLDLHGMHARLRPTRLAVQAEAQGDLSQQAIKVALAQPGYRYTLDGVASPERFTVRRARAVVGSGTIDASGSIALDDSRSFDLKATLANFDPSRLGDFRPASLNARIAASGAMAPLVQVRADVELRPSTAFGLPASGTMRWHSVGVDDSRIAVDIKTTIGDTRFDVSGRLVDPEDLRSLDLRLALSGQDLAQLYTITGLPFPPTPAYKVDGHLQYADHVWSFTRFSGEVGRSDVAGDFRIDRRTARPFMRADLTSQRLDMRDLGGFVGGLPEVPNPPGRVLPHSEYHLDKLNAADADIRFTGRRIRNETLPLNRMSTRLVLRNGVLTLDPLNFGAAGGDVEGMIRLDAQKPQIVAQEDMKGRNLKLNRLAPGVKAFLESSGTLEGRVQLAMRGNSVAALLGSANGDVVAMMNGGEISDLTLRLADLDIAHSLVALARGDRKIPLHCVVADFAAQDGVLTPRTLVLDAEHTTMTGQGKIDLRSEQLDLQLTAKPKDGSVFALRGPIMVAGTLATPSVRPDLTAAIARTGAAIALGALAPPAAALPFLQFGSGEAFSCAPKIESASRFVRAERG